MTTHQSNMAIPRPPFLGGGSWLLEDLNEITVLFGKNGSGKSMLLRGMLAQAPDSRHLAVPERPGEMTANPNLAEEETSGATRSSSRQQNTLANYRNRAFSRISVLLQKRGFFLKPGSTDDSINDIEGLMNDLLPDFTFRLTGGSPSFQLLRGDGTPVPSAESISSGEIGMVSLAIDLATVCAIWRLEGQPHRILLVDEPDTHLHPDLQEDLSAFFLRLVDKYELQLIVATHSTTLLSALGHHGKKRTSALYLNRSSGAQKAVTFTKHLQEVATCLGGHALMGPLFGAPLLLVEGDDDYRIWSQVPRHHVIKLAVLPCDGEEIFKFQKSLEQIFASLRTAIVPPAGYTLLDGDKSVPSSSTTPQQHVSFLRLSCHESENLYLTDEVLASLGLKWTDAQMRIKAEAHRFGEKESALLECDKWDRKESDIKTLINEIATALDSKSVHWTKRVGTAIGTSKPAGQLAEFLGPSVMHALWP